MNASRWVVIATFSVEVPSNDQWHVDVLGMYQPWLNGHLDWRFLFQPWQEHRLVFQKAYDLAMFVCLGHFSNAAQCFTSAVLWCLSVGLFFNRLIARQPEAMWLLLGLCLMILALPLGWENTSSGFQSQTYFCVAATTYAAWLFADGKFWAGLLVSFLGIFTLASGFLSAPACLVLLFTDMDTNETSPWKARSKVAGICAVCLAGLLLRGSAPQQAAHHAMSLWHFLGKAAAYAAWPAMLSPWLALFTLLPSAVLLYRRAKGLTDDTFCERLAVMLFVIGLGQALLTAYLRANMHSVVVSRYQDEFWPLLVAGVLAIYELGPVRFKLMTCGWLYAAVAGLVSLTWFTFTDSFYNQRIAMHNFVAETHVAYILHDEEAISVALPGKAYFPALDVAEVRLMPELAGLMADDKLMIRVPELWKDRFKP